MDYQRKQIIVQALIKLVQSSPEVQPQISSPYFLGDPNHDILMQEFNIWINYVNDVLKVTYDYTGLETVLVVQMNIMRFSSQNELLYKQRVFQIKNEILGLTQTILQYY